MAQGPAFDSASVKVNRSGFPGGITDFRAGGQFTATNVTLLGLIRAAYDIDIYRVTGGPEWLDTVRVDVQARAAADITRDRPA